MSNDPLSNHLTRLDLLISIGFLLICALLCTLTSITLIPQVIKDKEQIPQQKKKMALISKIFLISCACVATMDVYADLFRHVMCYIFKKDLYYYPLNNIMGFADFLYYFGSVLFYLIAISRLQISFHSTHYAINCYILLFFYTLIAATFILGTFYTMIVFLTPKDSNTNKTNDFSDHNFWAYYDTIPMIMLGVIDFILNTALLILFVSKLNQLTSSKLLNCDRNIFRNKNAEIFRTSSKLFMIMTRHTILFTFAIAANQIWYIAVLVQLNFDVPYFITSFCFRSLGNATNCIVLFLSFKQNLVCYLTICQCCHHNIRKCFITNIGSKFNVVHNENQNNYTKMLNDDTNETTSTTPDNITNRTTTYHLINSSNSIVNTVTSIQSTQ
eukprot:477142_1